MKRKYMFSALGFALLAIVTAVGVRTVKADDTSNYPPIIQKLADKFGLNVDDVKGVFDEQQSQRLQERQKVMEDRLSQAVEDGVITGEQKQALLEKQSQIANQRQTARQEMQQWFQDNGIDETKLAPYMGFRREGFGYHHMME